MITLKAIFSWHHPQALYKWDSKYYPQGHALSTHMHSLNLKGTKSEIIKHN